MNQKMAEAASGLSNRDRLVAGITGLRPLVKVTSYDTCGELFYEPEAYRFKKPLSPEDAEKLVSFVEKPVKNGMDSHCVWIYRMCTNVIVHADDPRRFESGFDIGLARPVEWLDMYEQPLIPRFEFESSLEQFAWVTGRELCLSCGEDDHPFRGKNPNRFYVNPHCESCGGYGELEIDQAIWMIDKGLPGCSARDFKAKHKFAYEKDRKKKSQVRQLPIK